MVLEPEASKTKTQEIVEEKSLPQSNFFNPKKGDVTLEDLQEEISAGMSFSELIDLEPEKKFTL